MHHLFSERYRVHLKALRKLDLKRKQAPDDFMEQCVEQVMQDGEVDNEMDAEMLCELLWDEGIGLDEISE